MRFREYGHGVKSEMHLRNRLAIPETRYHMHVRPVPFNLALMTLNCMEPADAGRLLGMVPKTITRALEGGAVSGDFIANVLAAFRLNSERLVRVGLVINQDQFFDNEPFGTSVPKELPAEERADA